MSARGPIDPPTVLQNDFIAALKTQLRLTSPLLDAHCVQAFGKPFRELSKRECSRLIDELKAWKAIPAELRRAQGQTDLPGFGL